MSLRRTSVEVEPIGGFFNDLTSARSFKDVQKAATKVGTGYAAATKAYNVSQQRVANLMTQLKDADEKIGESHNSATPTPVGVAEFNKQMALWRAHTEVTAKAATMKTGFATAESEAQALHEAAKTKADERLKSMTGVEKKIEAVKLGEKEQRCTASAKALKTAIVKLAIQLRGSVLKGQKFAQKVIAFSASAVKAVDLNVETAVTEGETKKNASFEAAKKAFAATEKYLKEEAKKSKDYVSECVKILTSNSGA